MNDYFLNENEIKCKDTGEVCHGYKEYLKSRHWEWMRNKRIHKGSKCAICGESKCTLQLHHLNYGNLGDEHKGDLMLVCPVCHQKIHDNDEFALFVQKYSKVFSGVETLKQHRQKKYKRKHPYHKYGYAYCSNHRRSRKVC